MWYAVFTRSMISLICAAVTFICYLGFRRSFYNGPFYFTLPLPIIITVFWVRTHVLGSNVFMLVRLFGYYYNYYYQLGFSQLVFAIEVDNNNNNKEGGSVCCLLSLLHVSVRREIYTYGKLSYPIISFQAQGIWGIKLIYVFIWSCSVLIVCCSH